MKDGRLSRGVRVAFVAAAAAGVVGLSACSTMTSVDRRLDRVMRDRSDRLGAPSPSVDGGVAATSRPSRDIYDETPGTVNPSAGDLDFEAADPNRNVLERLEGFYKPSDVRIVLDLEEAFRVAQRSAREYRTAEEEYIFAAIRYLVERHLWGPRFFNDTSALLGFDSVTGDYSAAVDIINEMRVTQRLPYGGDVEARLVTSAAHQLVDIVGDRTESSSALVLTADIPLLRNAGMIARETLIQAERDLVYAARSFERFRRQLLVDIARDYFNLVAAQASIENQENRLRSVVNLQRQREALVDAGRRAAFDARNVEQNVKRSQASLASSRDSYQLAIDRFKVRLGLPVDIELEIRPVSLVLPEPDVTTLRAAELALTYRLDYQTSVDRIADSERSVENAKNQLLPDLNVAAAATFGNDDGDDNLAPAYDLEDTDYSLGITFGLPLDREIERLGVRRAMIELERGRRNLDQTRDLLIVDSRAAVREIERSRFALELQEEAIRINETRLRELEIKQAETTAQQQLDAEDELLQSRNDRDAALRDLRVAILNYLLVTGQLRVADDGTFEALQGMVVRQGAPVAPGGGLGPGFDEAEEEARETGEGDLPAGGRPDGGGGEVEGTDGGGADEGEGDPSEG